MTTNQDGLKEIFLGGLVFAVAVAFLIYTVFTVGIKEELSTGKFTLYANFQSVDGLTLGSNVVLAGVKVGTVSEIELVRETFQAKVTLSLTKDYKLPDDTEAIINADGLLGGKYISLNVGGSDIALASGEELVYTQGSISILNLLSKFTSK